MTPHDINLIATALRDGYERAVMEADHDGAMVTGLGVRTWIARALEAAIQTRDRTLDLTPIRMAFAPQGADDCSRIRV